MLQATVDFFCIANHPLDGVKIDLRKEATIRIAAAAPYPLITFGPYPNPEALIVAFAQATGTCLISFANHLQAFAYCNFFPGYF